MYKPSDLCRISGAAGCRPDEKFRGAFRKDYGRLIHAPSFRRLQGKTQLFPGVESDFFRNRLTHSIEVSQIAGGLAQKFNTKTKVKRTPELMVDVDLVQFAGAAHDLGHPPFGHNGEHALDDEMRVYGGFEGNAQTLRILSRLEKKLRLEAATDNSDSFARLGLDLCYRSLAAILKYDSLIPGYRDEGDDFCKGYYYTEEKLVGAIKAAVSPKWDGKFKTIECQLMDVADDIAYSTYDLEDTLKAGFLSPMQVIQAVERDEGLVREIDEKVTRALKDDGRSSPAPVTSQEVLGLLTTIFFGSFGTASKSTGLSFAIQAAAHDRQFIEDGYVRTGMSATLIGYFMDAVEFKIDDRFPEMSECKLNEEVRRQVEILKRLNYSLTIRSPRLEVVQYRGYDLVRDLFRALTSPKGHGLLPTDVRELYDSTSDKLLRRRIVCDFIAGMTDRYAVEFHGRLHAGDTTIFKPH